MLEHVLFIEHAQLVCVRQRIGQRHNILVEKREAALDRMGHQHAVALRGQEIAAEQRVDLDVLILRQRTPVPELDRKAGQEFRDHIAARDCVTEGVAEQPLDRRGGAPTKLVTESWCLVARKIASEDAPRQCLARHRRAGEIGVQALERTRAQCAFGKPRPEAAHLGFAKEIVAAEHLVSAFAGQHRLDALRTHELRQQEQGCRGHAQ
ncbi:hypothetical protein D3C83_07360 [compost metagenome]